MRRRRKIHRPGPPCCHAAVPEDEQGASSLDPEFRGRLWFRIDIDLQEPCLRFDLVRDSVECWGYCLTRPIPRGPEIHDDGDVVPLDVTPEAPAADRGRFARIQRCAAFAEFRRSRAERSRGMRLTLSHSGQTTWKRSDP